MEFSKRADINILHAWRSSAIEATFAFGHRDIAASGGANPTISR